MIFGTRFFVVALDVANAAPWVRWVYRIQLWLGVVCLPAPFSGFYPEAIQILLAFVLVTMLTGTWRIIQLWRQGNDNAKALLLVHLFILSGNFFGISTLFGVLPGHFWLLYGFQLRSIATLLILQLMLIRNASTMQAKLAQINASAEIAKTIAQKERTEREHQRHFLSMLTHELKTPLSIIRLRLGAGLPTPKMQAHAERAVEDIDAIVGRCAMVSQLEDQAGQLQLIPCNLSELVSEILAQQRVA